MKITKYLLILSLSFIISQNVFSQSRGDIQNGAILHAWCWSFKNIEKNLPKIKSPRHDGYKGKFVQKFREEVTPILLKLLKK